MTGERFVHAVRPRYAEVDMQGVVSNAHWLTYFDEACTRYFGHLGYEAAEAFFKDFDVMLVKAVAEWTGPAGFDEIVSISVAPSRMGTKSFDLRYEAGVGDRPVCIGTITYVSVTPGSHDSTPIPHELRARLDAESIRPLSARSAPEGAQGVGG